MQKRILDRDAVSGITTYFQYNELTDETTLSRTQDAQPTLDSNAILLKDGDYTKRQLKADLPHVARIPAVLIEKWMNEEGLNLFNREHWPAIRARLNSMEYNKLRTSLGRI